MIITKADRRVIYEALFKAPPLVLHTDGVLVAKKDYNAPKHLELDVKNLLVIKACQSLTSRGYVSTQFSWQYYYYTLTPEGIDYLREFLHLPAEIVPATFKKQVRAARPGQQAGGRPDGAYRAPRGGDEGYRRRDDKKEGAGEDFRPRFSGVGRGGPRPTQA
ncbi:BZ3500_MvSof-1268-A1-R1_Chr6-1g08385 [Microbotryum saponariae]|uniref:BZ3500_MvSof-1268-A1-R1_Chr6-1g08385 protein n=1 Tax=Microbotryum saponariae TaxID=289078 RepID=A0A2X0KR56_9BASI|nr:BZ3500_MvSof-1268-A1-R1_Chr6-1g08385 [Microbotryum saponariae]SDA07669.1 BZ3501_MvSof-1269-A2-R1_Chr6-1g08106 [Microbotryum saponariae]